MCLENPNFLPFKIAFEELTTRQNEKVVLALLKPGSAEFTIFLLDLISGVTN